MLLLLHRRYYLEGATSCMEQTLNMIPAVNTWEALRGLTRAGFLDYVGELWHRHGDTFQINILKRRMLVAIHPDAVRYVTVINRANYDKLQSYDVVRRFILGNGLVASNGDLWRRQRRLMAPFYTPKGVQAYGEIMLKDGHRLRDRWSNMAGSNVHIGEEMTYVTASIILRAMFSMETDEAIIRMKNAVEAMIGYAGRNQTGIMLPMWNSHHSKPCLFQGAAGGARLHSIRDRTEA